MAKKNNTKKTTAKKSTVKKATQATKPVEAPKAEEVKEEVVEETVEESPVAKQPTEPEGEDVDLKLLNGKPGHQTISVLWGTKKYDLKLKLFRKGEYRYQSQDRKLTLTVTG